MSKSFEVKIKVTTNAEVNSETVARLIKMLVNAGLADAQRTIENDEGDIKDASLATDLNIGQPTASAIVEADIPQSNLTMVEQFFQMLNAANAVSVDGGPLLTEWNTGEDCGEPEKHLVEFNWTDGDYDYWEKLSEAVILDGHFDEEGNFHCQTPAFDADTTITFFGVKGIKPQAALQAEKFSVRWAIDSDAETALDAAKDALFTQRNPSSEAVVFEVRDRQGKVHVIDLGAAEHA